MDTRPLLKEIKMLASRKTASWSILYLENFSYSRRSSDVLDGGGVGLASVDVAWSTVVGSVSEDREGGFVTR